MRLETFKCLVVWKALHRDARCGYRLDAYLGVKKGHRFGPIMLRFREDPKNVPPWGIVYRARDADVGCDQFKKRWGDREPCGWAPLSWPRNNDSRFDVHARISPLFSVLPLSASWGNVGTGDIPSNVLDLSCLTAWSAAGLHITFEMQSNRQHPGHFL